MVSARIQHALFEGNDGSRWAVHVFERGLGTRRKGPVNLAVALPAGYSTAGTSEVYFCSDPPLSRRPGPPWPAARGRAVNGPDARAMPETPGWQLSRRHGGVMGRTGRNRANVARPPPKWRDATCADAATAAPTPGHCSRCHQSPLPMTDVDPRFRVHRRDRFGGILHEYQHAALPAQMRFSASTRPMVA